MPPILHFQTWSRDPHDPLVMNYAWSTVGYPTLFISQSFGAKNCTNQAFHANMTEYEDSQSYGSVYVAGSESDSAVAIVFRRIIEFDGGKKSRASGAFNSSEAANDSSTEYYSTYLDDSSMKWYYDPEDRKITGKSDTFKSLIFSVSHSFYNSKFVIKIRFFVFVFFLSCFLISLCYHIKKEVEDCRIFLRLRIQ